MNPKYVALLRGINVGGSHKVPMAELKKELLNLGFVNVETLLNSGNVIFEAPAEPTEALLEVHLQQVFGFPIPVLLQTGDTIQTLVKSNPFNGITVTKDIRLYTSFLKDRPKNSPPLPWSSLDGSFKILTIEDRIICSVLDLALSQTTKAMEALEQMFGKNITTRNWNTIVRIAEKCAK